MSAPRVLPSGRFKLIVEFKIRPCRLAARLHQRKGRVEVRRVRFAGALALLLHTVVDIAIRTIARVKRKPQAVVMLSVRPHV